MSIKHKYCVVMTYYVEYLNLCKLKLFAVINAHLTARYRVRVARRTDERVRLMDEIVLGIQVIKLYAWEKPFQSFIESARK